jgi:hypothetical protein
MQTLLCLSYDLNSSGWFFIQLTERESWYRPANFPEPPDFLTVFLVRQNLSSCLIEIYKGFQTIIKGKKFGNSFQFLYFQKKLAKIGSTGVITEVHTV